jgi:hypothetical protein
VKVQGHEILAVDIYFTLWVALIYGLFITCGKSLARDRREL